MILSNVVYPTLEQFLSVAGVCDDIIPQTSGVYRCIRPGSEYVFLFAHKGGYHRLEGPAKFFFGLNGEPKFHEYYINNKLFSHPADDYWNHPLVKNNPIVIQRKLKGIELL